MRSAPEPYLSRSRLALGSRPAVAIRENKSSTVRGVAGLCFGHLARIHRQLDRDVVLPVLRKLADDPETRGQATDALSDIEIFVRA